jgi:hypothetical protein
MQMYETNPRMQFAACEAVAALSLDCTLVCFLNELDTAGLTRIGRAALPVARQLVKASALTLVLRALQSFAVEASIQEAGARAVTYLLPAGTIVFSTVARGQHAGMQLRSRSGHVPVRSS